MSQNTQKLAALLKAQQALISSSSRPSTVARRCRCDGGRCTGWQTDGPGRYTNTRHMTVPRVLEFPFVLGRGFDVAEIEVLVWQALTRASYAYPSLPALCGAAPAPVVTCVATTPAVTCAALAPADENAAPATTVAYAASVS